MKVHACRDMHMEVRGQLVRVSSLLLPCGSRDETLFGHQN